MEQRRAQIQREHPEESYDLTSPRYDHDAVLLDDGRVLLGGGFTGVANNNVIVPFPMGLVELYDPETDVWTPLDPVEGPGYLYSLVKLTDGSVLALGVGESGDDVESMAALFDPATSLWSELPGSPDLIRAFPDAFLLDDGTVLVAGGLDFFSDPSAYSPGYVEEFEIFDPSTGKWQRAASPPSSSSQSESTSGESIFVQLADGRVVTLGREDTDEFWSDPRAEIYDPSTDTWTLVGGLDPHYYFVGGIALSDGRLLAQGGLSEYSLQGFSRDADGRILDVILRDGTELNAEELEKRFGGFRIYDPEANTWEQSGETIYSRPLAILTLLPDGRVLAAGGEEGWMSDEEGSADYNRPRYTAGAPLELPHSTTEIYDPETNTWSLGPDLLELRLGSTATVLLDGRVLLAGGIGMVLDIEEIYPLPTSEIVDPNASPGTPPETGSR